jgi:hypothetical protein
MVSLAHLSASFVIMNDYHLVSIVKLYYFGI